jgi:hypothetical protein
MKGWIYCLSNECMPGVFKVGMTKYTPEKRALQLSRTSVPTDFVIEFAKKVDNIRAAEIEIHNKLKHRVNENREFFKDSLQDIFELFDNYEGDWYGEGNYYSGDCYIVESILDVKVENNNLYFKIKWEGYSEKECTWEPLENLQGEMAYDYINKRIKEREIDLQKKIQNENNYNEEKLNERICLLIELNKYRKEYLWDN